jgi:hypothetical protein
VGDTVGHQYLKAIGTSPVVVASLDPARFGSYGVIADAVVSGHQYSSGCGTLGCSKIQVAYPRCWVRTEFMSIATPSGVSISHTESMSDRTIGRQDLGVNGIVKGGPSSSWIQLVCETVTSGNAVTLSPQISNYKDELTAIQVSSGQHQTFARPRNSFHRSGAATSAGRVSRESKTQARR